MTVLSKLPDYLELGEDSLSSGQGNSGGFLLGSVDDLAMVNYDGISVGPLRTGPANLRREGNLRVADEELFTFISS